MIFWSWCVNRFFIHLIVSVNLDRLMIIRLCIQILWLVDSITWCRWLIFWYLYWMRDWFFEVGVWITFSFVWWVRLIWIVWWLVGYAFKYYKWLIQQLEVVDGFCKYYGMPNKLTWLVRESLFVHVMISINEDRYGYVAMHSNITHDWFSYLMQ